MRLDCKFDLFRLDHTLHQSRREAEEVRVNSTIASEEKDVVFELLSETLTNSILPTGLSVTAKSKFRTITVCD